MSVFFIVTVEIADKNERGSYDEYIAKVKPIIESYGGRYLIRSEKITVLSGIKSPGRVIVIQFDSRQQLDECFASAEYASVKGLRENSVKASAVIVE